MLRCSITRPQLTSALLMVNAAAIAAGSERATVDVFVAHMKSKSAEYPVTETEEGKTATPEAISKYWADKYTAFRAEASTNAKAFKTGKKKVNGVEIAVPKNPVLADQLEKLLKLTKLGAAPRAASSADVWGDIGAMVAEFTKPKVEETAGQNA